VDAELAQHAGEVDAGGGPLGVGEAQRVGAEQRGAQRIGVGDARPRGAARHRDAGGHAAEVGARVGAQGAVGHQRVDHRGGDDEHVARLASLQRFLHRAHGPEARGQRWRRCPVSSAAAAP
jgi:hypothetical protein